MGMNPKRDVNYFCRLGSEKHRNLCAITFTVSVFQNQVGCFKPTNGLPWQTMEVYGNASRNKTKWQLNISFIPSWFIGVCSIYPWLKELNDFFSQSGKFDWQALSTYTDEEVIEKIWFWVRSDFFAFCRTFPQMAMLDPKSVLSFDASCDAKLVGLILVLRHQLFGWPRTLQVCDGKWDELAMSLGMVSTSSQFISHIFPHCNNVATNAWLSEWTTFVGFMTWPFWGNTQYQKQQIARPWTCVPFKSCTKQDELLQFLGPNFPRYLIKQRVQTGCIESLRDLSWYKWPQMGGFCRVVRHRFKR